MGGLIDITGDRFGDWTVLRRHDQNSPLGKPLWWCKCVCGKELVVNSTNLRSGKTRRCRECGYASRHGLSRHPLYPRWSSMVARCHNQKNKDYEKYGARGISVHKEWRYGPTKFVEYVENVLGEKPDPSYTIDRVNNDGNYEPGNIRWADKMTQSHNSRKRFVSVKAIANHLKLINNKKI